LKSGQFDDMDGAAERILMDDDFRPEDADAVDAQAAKDDEEEKSGE
jgi:nitrogen fixation-related uncharacterized protein